MPEQSYVPIDGARHDVAPARLAVAVFFVSNGFLTGSFIPHIPLIMARLDLSAAVLGGALFVMAVGAVLAMPLAGALIARRGSAPVAIVAAVCLCLVIPLLAISPSLATLMGALFLYGATTGSMDVAMNAHGVGVEERLGRPVMSSFHGWWSAGGFLGALVAWVVLPHFGGVVHLTGAAVLVLGAIMFWAARRLLPSSIDRGGKHRALAMPHGLAWRLGILAFIALLGEGAILDWSAVLLDQRYALKEGSAGIGFAAFAATMAAGRFAGDSLRARIGDAALIRASAALASLGLCLALLPVTLPVSLVGFALTGIALSNVAPILFGAAGRIPGQSPGAGMAAVVTLGYSGFLVGPPLIGSIAELTSLPLSLALVVGAFLVLLPGASWLKR